MSIAIGLNLIELDYRELILLNNWNKLPDNVVLGKLVNLFKNGVDKVLSRYMDKYSYDYGMQ